MEILDIYSEHGLKIGEAEIKLPDKEIDIELPKELLIC
jgi:hypothetical protein